MDFTYVSIALQKKTCFGKATTKRTKFFFSFLITTTMKSCIFGKGFGGLLTM